MVLKPIILHKFVTHTEEERIKHEKEARKRLDDTNNDVKVAVFV